MVYKCTTLHEFYNRRYHREVVVVVGRRKAMYRTTLIFLIESGALYCITWVRCRQTSLRQSTHTSA